ncbi:MAG: glucose-1-phosphate adenylyltransferase subunit GlgD [Epulopiscium sp.]|nr:glucose-1-phosphate adenylyltransferase subunit GlgD [Candidatus Epulonipiscium sp.]
MKAIGIILTDGKNEQLGDLAMNRAVASMPIASSYRAIDFAMSNMANSGIQKVGVITQYNSRSLIDHLSSAKWWDLGRKHGGLFIFSPYLTQDNFFWYRGTADALYQNISFLRRSNEPYVVIAPGEQICKIDYKKILNYHVEQKADITLVCKSLKEEECKKMCSDYTVVQVDENQRIIHLEDKPLEPLSTIIFMDIYIIQRTLLIKLLEKVCHEEQFDLVNDLLIRYRKKLNIKAYFFQEYWKNIRNIKDYYDINMDFLNQKIRNVFLKKAPYILTKVKDEAPAKYNRYAKVKNSLIGDGCIINGDVDTSILFRRVYIGDQTQIQGVFILEGSYIGNNCIVQHAIIDEEVVVSDGKKIIGKPEDPIIVRKGTVI